MSRHCYWSCMLCVLSCFSHIWLSVTSWTVALQAPLSVGFSRQKYWSGLQCLPPGDLPNPGIEPESLMSSALGGGFFITSTTWEVHWSWSRPIFLCPHWELVWFPGFPRTWAMTCFPLVCNHWKPQLNFPDSSCPFSLISSCFFWQTCLDWPSCLSDSV